MTFGFNISGIQLTPEETEFLSKGPNFSVNSYENDTDKFSFYPPLRDVKLPTQHPEIEIIQKSSRKYLELLKKFEKMKMKSNLSKTEWNKISSLRSRDVVIDSSDKGGEFCLTNKNLYRNLMIKELTETGKFRRVA